MKFEHAETADVLREVGSAPSGLTAESRLSTPPKFVLGYLITLFQQMEARTSEMPHVQENVIR